MANHPSQAFVDTVQIVPEKGTEAPDTGVPQADFAATVQVEGEVWAEAPDFQSSESATLFATTQPGKLNVV